MTDHQWIMWDAFVSGDLAAFARLLLAAEDEPPVDPWFEKLRDDGGFAEFCAKVNKWPVMLEIKMLIPDRRGCVVRLSVEHGPGKVWQREELSPDPDEGPYEPGEYDPPERPTRYRNFQDGPAFNHVRVDEYHGSKIIHLPIACDCTVSVDAIGEGMNRFRRSGPSRLGVSVVMGRDKSASSIHSRSSTQHGPKRA